MTTTEKPSKTSMPPQEIPSHNSAQADEFLTPAEAAKLLKLSTQTIRRLINDGELPAFKPSKRRWLILRDSLRAWAYNKSMVDTAVTVLTHEEDVRMLDEAAKEFSKSRAVIVESNSETITDALFDVVPSNTPAATHSDPSYGDALQETPNSALQETPDSIIQNTLVDSSCQGTPVNDVDDTESGN